MIFGVRGDIADVITHTKFYVNRFRGFGILTPPILPFSIGLAGRPYNSVSTTVLHCDPLLYIADISWLDGQLTLVNILCHQCGIGPSGKHGMRLFE